MKKKINKKEKKFTEEKECGCKWDYIRIPIDNKGHWQQWGNRIHTCQKHIKEEQENETRAKEFATFPSEESKEIYDILDKMINDLYDAGVDVSYFPDRARQVIKDAAILLSDKQKDTIDEVLGNKKERTNK